MAGSPDSLLTYSGMSDQENRDPLLQFPSSPLIASVMTQLDEDPFLSKPLQGLRNSKAADSGRHALQQLPNNVNPGYYTNTESTAPFECQSLVPYRDAALASPQGSDPTLLGSLTPGDEMALFLGEPGPTLRNQHAYQQMECFLYPGYPVSTGVNIGGLSLNSSGYVTADSRSHQMSSGRSRRFKSTGILPTKAFALVFNDIKPTDVVVIYDKGKAMAKVDKELICSCSSYFAKVFDGPFMEHHTRIVRLRGDFPCAIQAMMSFIIYGYYALLPSTLFQYPLMTMLDLHVHAYLVSDKYEVPLLGDYAMDQYLQNAAHILSLNFDNYIPGMYTTSFGAAAIDSDDEADGRPLIEPHHPMDQWPAAEMDRFLDSLVLLWRNTGGGFDDLRQAVLELMKPSLHRLAKLKMFRAMLAGLKEFLEDLHDSLEDDGIEFTLRADGRPVRWGMAFG